MGLILNPLVALALGAVAGCAIGYLIARFTLADRLKRQTAEIAGLKLENRRLTETAAFAQSASAVSETRRKRPARVR